MPNRVILIDGNNLLFRSYYATAYSGNMLKILRVFQLMLYMVLSVCLIKLLQKKNQNI